MSIGFPEIIMILILLSILTIPVLIGIGIVWYLNSKKKPPKLPQANSENSKR
jgi:hypothetical protein